MAKKTQNVLIKGTKDGLMFLLHDTCSFDELLHELKEKLENSHQKFLTGPMMKVTLKTGTRKLSLYEEEQIREVFKIKGNLFIHSIEDEVNLSGNSQYVKIITGTIRSGQIYQFDESILFVGDVNPGGNIISSGDIYILGSLRGVAHAGSKGNLDSIIVASIMEPTLLRIGDLISYPQEKRPVTRSKQEYAYIEDNKITIGQIQHFSKAENLLSVFK